MDAEELRRKIRGVTSNVPLIPDDTLLLDMEAIDEMAADFAAKLQETIKFESTPHQVFTPLEQLAILLQRTKTHIERYSLQDGIAKKTYTELSRILFEFESAARDWLSDTAAALRDEADRQAFFKQGS